MVTSQHPDNPSNIEAAAEHFAEAVAVSKTGNPGAPPWGKDLTAAEAIKFHLANIEALLLNVPCECDYTDSFCPVHN